MGQLKMKSESDTMSQKKTDSSIPEVEHRQGLILASDSKTHGASISLKSVSKLYGSKPAVDDVSLEIEAGEFITLLGPSGSGKTTTLNMIAGFTDVTTGHILLDGAPIERKPPHKRDIGVVFQNYALFPHMTVNENVAFPLRRRRIARKAVAARVQSALEMVQLEDLGGRYPHELSGGQQQRVALARALVFEPSVLLMDEPLGALDKKLREWLQLEIKRIHDDIGITFVFVTHDQEEALVLSDRIALFNEGRIEQLGTVEDLYLRPSTQFSAKFLGESNLIHGTVESAGMLSVSDSAPLRYINTDEGRVGQTASVLVRPERIAVLERDEDADNTMQGRITQVLYLGSARRLEVLCGDMLVLIREQAGAFSPYGDGDTVTFGWSSSDTRFVKASAN